MNLIVAILMTVAGLAFLGYYPSLRKELQKKVSDGSISAEKAESDSKKMKLGATIVPILGILLLALELTGK